MGRYFIRGRSSGWVGDDLYDEDRGGLMPDITVVDSGATETGLVDSDGNAIMRMPNPIGFGRDEEW